MFSKKFFIWVNILLILAILLIVLENPTVQINDYEDPLLHHFGMSKQNILSRYGTPDFRGNIGGPGGEVFLYEEMGISFIFAGGASVVNNMEVYTGKNFLDVEIGMTFDEIEEVLGVPQKRGYDHYEEDFTMVYYLGEKNGTKPEIEIWFSAKKDDEPTEKAQLFWKKFWQEDEA